MKDNTELKKDEVVWRRKPNVGRTWNLDCVRSCFFVAGYSALLIAIVFLTDILKGNAKGADSVYAMSQQADTIQTAWDEVDGMGMGSEDWWIGSIQANLENVLKNSMHKYMESQSLGGYGNDSIEAMVVERQGLLARPEEKSGTEGRAGEALPAEDGLGELQPSEGGLSEPQPGEVQPNEGQPSEPQTTETQPSNQQPTDGESDEKNVSKKKNKEKKSKSNKKKIVLSKEDKGVLLRIVEAEATGESIKGKMLVANVVLNRVNNKHFPNTVKKVVFQNNGRIHQFSPISDGRYWSVRISKDTQIAVNRVLNGEDHSEGALYFMSRKSAKPRNVRWFDSNLKWLYKYGTHEFYK